MTQKVATGGTPSKAPSQLHDLTVARDTGVIGPLNWAASQLDLPTLADSGYDGAGQGIKRPIKQSTDEQALAPDNQAYNTLLRSTRCLGERGFALLTGRWRALRRVTNRRADRRADRPAQRRP